MVDIQFSLFGRFPRDRPAFVADTFHTMRELGLQYHTGGVRGKYLYQDDAQGSTTVVEEPEPGDPTGAKFAAAVERVRASYWPHIWFEAEVPREDTRRGKRTVGRTPVVAAVREMAQIDSPATAQRSRLQSPWSPLRHRR